MQESLDQQMARCHDEDQIRVHLKTQAVAGKRRNDRSPQRSLAAPLSRNKDHVLNNKFTTLLVGCELEQM